MIRTFPGGTVTSPDRFHGFINTYFDRTAFDRARHWYELQWHMLTRRLRYPGRKARNARRRLLVHWTAADIDAALAATEGK